MTPEELTDAALLHTGMQVSVSRGRRAEDGLPVIIKTLIPEAQTPGNVGRLRYEYRILTLLEKARVRCVPAPLGFFESAGMAGFMMSDMGGSSLRTLLRQTTFTLPQVLSIGLRVAEALAQLHRVHVIHRDINPANVVMNPKTNQVQVIDFDLASVLQRETAALTPLRSLEGTLLYMSPEQTGRMNRGVDHRTDFYSLGIMLYELLAGQPPFGHEGGDAAAMMYAILAQPPPALMSVSPQVPPMLAQVVHKLIAKIPDDRYTSAFGVAADLRACAEQLRQQSTAQVFTLGSCDRDERFDIPQKLYGRDHEASLLTAAYTRAAAGHLELVWVGGVSGMGKSALVNELHRRLVEHGGLFAAGKYDQLRRNIPFSALSQAITQLVRRWLAEPNDVVEMWQRRLREALGRVGAALVEVAPTLSLLVGPQAPVPALGPAETEARLLSLLQRFLLAVCKRQPLVLFLDDVQWADPGTVKLLKHLTTQAYTGAGLLVVAAMRDQEMAADHPMHEVIRNPGAVPALSLHVAPLTLPAITQLVSDATHTPPAHASELAELVLSKTGGNAFFVHAFLRSLYEKSLLSYEPEAARWAWNIETIQRMTVTTYIADLLADRLRSLAPAVQRLLSIAACLGHEIHLQLLCEVQDAHRAAVVDMLQRTMEEGILLPQQSTYRYTDDHSLDITYRFAHDRIQKAAYELLDKAQERATHHAIARALLTQKDSEILDVAQHLVIAEPHVQNDAERISYAHCCAAAGRQAIDAMAYAAAEFYLQASELYMPSDAWQSHYRLMRSTQLAVAEVEHLQGKTAAAETRLDLILQHAAPGVEQAEVHTARLHVLSSVARLAEAIDAGVAAVRCLGLKLPRKPTLGHVGVALLRVRFALLGVKVADMAAAPEITSPDASHLVHNLLQIVTPAVTAEPLMSALVSLHACRLICQHGNVPTTDVYVAMMLISVQLNDYTAAKTWRNGIRICERQFPENPWPAAIAAFAEAAYIDHLNKPSSIFVDQMNDVMHQASLVGAVAIGDHALLLACFMQSFLSVDACRAHLERVRDAMDAKRSDSGGLQALYQWTQCMQGETLGPTSFETAAFDETQYYQRLPSNAIRAVWHHQKLHAALLHRDFDLAISSAQKAEAARIAETNVDATVVFFAFHVALAHTQARRGLRTGTFRRAYKKLRVVAAISSLYTGMKTLIDAELRGLAERVPEALFLYEKAVGELGASTYICLHALSLECAGRYYLRLQLQTAAVAYFNRCWEAYRIWGTRVKCRALEREIAALTRRADDSAPSRNRATEKSTFKSSEDHDTWSGHEASALTQAALALSGEVQQEQLVQRILQSLQQVAGATRAVLLLNTHDSLQNAGDTQPGAGLPDDVIRFVLRTGEALLVSNVASNKDFDNDYFRVAKPKTILCVPFARQGKTVGVAYLENNLATDTFGRKQLAVVQALAAQATISLLNAELYANLEQEVARATQELKQAHAKMLQMEKQNTELQMAGGFAHEMGNALSVAAYPLQSAVGPVEGHATGTLMMELNERIASLEAWAKSPQPLEGAALTALAQELREQYQGLDDVFTSVHNGVSRALRITARVLAYAEVSQLTVPDDVVDVGLVVDQVLQAWNDRLQQNAVIVQTRLSPNLWMDMNAAHATEIVSSLVANANDALALRSDGERLLIVSAMSYAGVVVISVEDTGEGMPVQVQERLFQPFFSTKGAKGTGLTLGFCRKLLQVYGGEIGFESTSGRGSVFRVSVPKR